MRLRTGLKPHYSERALLGVSQIPAVRSNATRPITLQDHRSESDFISIRIVLTLPLVYLTISDWLFYWFPFKRISFFFFAKHCLASNVAIF